MRLSDGAESERLGRATARDDNDGVWRNELAPKVAAEYLSGLGRRWQHVQSVGRLADTLASHQLIADYLAAAAWLHDIGYAEELVSTGLHPLDGARFLAAEGAPKDVVALVGRHTGAEFEAEARGLSAEMDQVPEPDPDDLDTLTFLDLVTAPDGSSTDPETRVMEILSRYSDSHPVHLAVSRSRPELLAAAERARTRLGLSDDWPAGVLERVSEP